MYPTKHHSRLLFKKIAIKLFAANEVDPPLPIPAILCQAFKFKVCRGNLDVQLALGLKAALPNVCVMQKVRYREP